MFTPDAFFPVLARLAGVLGLWITKGSHKSRRDVKQIMLRANATETAFVHELADQMSLRTILDEVLAEPDEIDA